MGTKLPVVDTVRCIGACCKGFTIYDPKTNEPHTYSSILERADKIEDGVFIADMVVPIYGPLEIDGKPGFNCRHHLPNGDCGIYDKRPGMCSRHGLTVGCDMPDCPLASSKIATWQAKLRSEWTDRRVPKDPSYNVSQYIRDIVVYIGHLREKHETAE